MMWEGGAFLGALTPKFYVALTGTSSLISGLILIFEWWYFRKYGTSFIEQVSLAHLGPWLGAPDPDPQPQSPPQDCKVWRNPMALLRGAEYGRLWASGRRAPLTYYDMNLSAQEHQAWFGGGAAGAGDPAEEAMSLAWREREPAARVAAARAALAHRPDCAPALLLLAEEESPTVVDAERALRRACRAAEAAVRSSAGSGLARRDAAVAAHARRTLAACARRLGRLRDAARLYRELARDPPPSLHALALHENLIEVLLEQRAYADVQAVVSRCSEAGVPPSASLLYTAALVRARAVSTSPQPAELAALEAMRRAIEFNPIVPLYLLEQRALTLPPEHIVRRGASEALAYSFAHLAHWKLVPDALRLLEAAYCAWQWGGGGGGGSSRGGGEACARCVDRELVPPHHAHAPHAHPAPAPPARAARAAACCLAALAAALIARYLHAAADPSALLRLIADL